jgi:F0F1-type ATP synthase assembly protein I
MQGRFGPMTIIRDRFRWGGYGFFGGLLLGVVLGWLFHGVVSTALWVLLVIALLIPLAAVVFGWRRLTGGGRPEETVESTSYVIEAQTEPRER